MAQVVQTKTDVSLSSGANAASLFSSLTSGAGIGSQSGGVFASLLDAADSALQQMKNATSSAAQSVGLGGAASSQTDTQAARSLSPAQGGSSEKTKTQVAPIPKKETSDRAPEQRAVDVNGDADQKQTALKDKVVEADLEDAASAKTAEENKALDQTADLAEGDAVVSDEAAVSDEEAADCSLLALLFSGPKVRAEEKSSSDTKGEKVDQETSTKKTENDEALTEMAQGAIPAQDLAAFGLGKEKVETGVKESAATKTVKTQVEVGGAQEIVAAAASLSEEVDGGAFSEEEGLSFGKIIAAVGEEGGEASTLSFQASNDNGAKLASSFGQQSNWSPELKAEMATQEAATAALAVQASAQGTPQSATSGAAGQNAALDIGAVAQGASSLDATSSLGVVDRPSASYQSASQLSAVGSEKSTGTTASQVVEQVAVQLNKAVKAGKEEMTINLRPAELGKIEVKLEFTSDHKVHGTVVADKAETLQLLQKDSDALQRALQDAGFTTDSGSLQFSLRGDGQSGSFAQGQSDSGASSSSFASEAQQKANEVTASADETETYYIMPGRVNLRV